MVEEVTLKDWFDMKKQRDEQIFEASKEIKVRRCQCGKAYSYGYYPVWDDPGACQGCRGAEGDILA